MRDLFDELVNLIEEVSDLECQSPDDDNIDCFTNWSKNLLEFDSLCVSCRARELLNRHIG